MNPYNGHATAAYRQAARAVHPTVAVVKAYDEALLALQQAIRAREAGEHETCFSRVLRTATVLRGLAHCLDFDKGGAVSVRLERVYKSYILALHLNFGKPDAAARYRTLFEGLVELRDAWAGIAGVRPYGQVASLDSEAAAAFQAAAARSARLRNDAPPPPRAGLSDPIFATFAPPPAPAPAAAERSARPRRLERRRSESDAGDGGRPKLRSRPKPRPGGPANAL